MTAGLYGTYGQQKPKETCEYCGKDIRLIPFGEHYKWAAAGLDWKCGNDPAFPVRAHKPKGAKK